MQKSNFCCRGSSIKTRIETNVVIIFNCTVSLVAEVVPLKQGLKHLPWYVEQQTLYCVAEVVPLKQGLKHQKPLRFR